MEKRVTVLEEKVKAHDKSIIALSTRVCSLEESSSEIKVLKEKVGRIDTNVEKIDAKLEKQAENKHGKYWQVLFYIFTTSVGSLIGYLISLR